MPTLDPDLTLTPLAETALGRERPRLSPREALGQLAAAAADSIYPGRTVDWILVREKAAAAVCREVRTHLTLSAAVLNDTPIRHALLNLRKRSKVKRVGRRKRAAA